jgi:hypothetical protein
MEAPTGTGQNSRFSATRLTKIVSATGDTFIIDGGYNSSQRPRNTGSRLSTKAFAASR